MKKENVFFRFDVFRDEFFCFCVFLLFVFFHFDFHEQAGRNEGDYIGEIDKRRGIINGRNRDNFGESTSEIQ